MSILRNVLSTITQSNSSTVIINGKVFHNVKGNNIVCTDKGIYIDGKPMEEYKEPIIVNLTIQGNVDSIDSECGDIKIEGDVINGIANKNGNVSIKGNVTGNVESKNGNITIAGSVSGDCTSKNGNIIH